MRNERTSLWWYAIVFAANGVALLLNVFLGAWIWPNVHTPFLVAVLLCARFGGMGPGLAAIILASECCTALLLFDPGMEITPYTIGLRVGVFASVELLIVFLMVARTKADRALRASEADFRAIFELAAVGKSLADPGTGRFIRVNRKIGEITGYSAPELLERTIRDITHPEDRDWSSLAYQRLVRGEIPEYNLEKRYVRKDGGIVWVHVNATAIRDAKGNPLRTAAVIKDITARKQAEAASRESQRRFRAMADTVPSVVWVAQDNGRLTYLNDRWYETTGGTPENSLGWGWADFVHPDDRERSVDAWRTCIGEGKVLETEERFRCADGGYRWFLTRAVPRRDEAGQIVEWFGTCTDIDAQKQMQAALVEATQAKDRFLAVLSHELRTPLTPVLLAITALQENAAQCGSCSCQTNLEMIRANIELEARLIDDLLDISRIARGQMTYRFEPVDMHALIRRAARVYWPDLNLKGHHLALELTASGYHVHGDPARLQQVFWNLLSNAAKYTPEWGHITIRTRSQTGARLRIEVVDDGVGIRPEEMAHLFDPFERGHGATAFYAGGLGLGLAICRSIAEAHHGTLTGFSEGRNKGCTFALELATIPAPINGTEPKPTRSPVTGTEPKSTRSPVNGRRLRILLAEDNFTSASVIADILRSKGHVVTLATSLHQALEAASNHIDLLVSDLDLGDGSGLELMKHIRSLGNTPGIALSGYATADDVRESLEAGFATHLAKPVTLSALESAITQVTTQRA